MLKLKYNGQELLYNNQEISSMTSYSIWFFFLEVIPKAL